MRKWAVSLNTWHCPGSFTSQPAALSRSQLSLKTQSCHRQNIYIIIYMWVATVHQTEVGSSSSSSRDCSLPGFSVRHRVSGKCPELLNGQYCLSCLSERTVFPAFRCHSTPHPPPSTPSPEHLVLSRAYWPKRLLDFHTLNLTEETQALRAASELNPQWATHMWGLNKTTDLNLGHK